LIQRFFFYSRCFLGPVLLRCDRWRANTLRGNGSQFDPKACHLTWQTGTLFAEYNQEDATFLNLFISVRRSTCYKRVFPSIIRSSKLHVQRQVLVRPLLLPAASLVPPTLAAGSSNGLTNTWRCMCSFELLMMDGKSRILVIVLFEYTEWRKKNACFLICLRFLSLGLPQIKSLRSKNSYSRRSESFHSRRNCNCATRNVSKCDAELWGEAPEVCTARRTASFRYNFSVIE